MPCGLCLQMCSMFGSLILIGCLMPFPTQLQIVQTTLGRRAHWVAAQCCLQPGLSKVLNSLMRQSDHSSEFYIVPGMDRFAGTPFSYYSLVPISITIQWLLMTPLMGGRLWDLYNNECTPCSAVYGMLFTRCDD